MAPKGRASSQEAVCNGQVSSNKIQSLTFEAYEEHDQTQVKHRTTSEDCDHDRHPCPCRGVVVAPIKCSFANLS